MTDLQESAPPPVALGTRMFDGFRSRVPLGAALLAALTITPAVSQPAPRPHQQPADVFDESIVVREATVFVRARSRRGPVTGLEKERFSVRIGEAELPIVGFEELRVRETRSDRRSRPAMEDAELLGRNLLVVFDGRFTPRPYLLDSVRAVRRSLDELGAEDRMAIVLWTGRAQLILPYTNDPNQLEAAFIYLTAILDAKPREAAEAAQILGELSNEPATRLGLGLRAELTRRNPSIGQSVDFTFVNQFAAFDPAESLQAVELAENNELAGTIAESNEALADLARTLSDVAGPRFAILFGRGVPGFQNLIQGRTAWDAGTISSVTGSFNALTSRLRGNGWVVDTIDVTGVGGRSTAVSMADSSPRSFDSQSIAATPRWVERGGLAGNDSDSLFLIAEQTGGDMYDNRNSLRDALRRSLEASSHSYRLVVQIPDTVRLDDRRGAVRLAVDIADLPPRADVRHSFAADWAMPARLRSDSAVDQAHAELVGTRRAKPLPPLLAHMTVHLLTDSPSSLQRVLVVLDLDPNLLGGAEEVSLIAVASPVEATGGDGSIFDLWTEEIRLGPEETEAVLATTDLLIPCAGARVRVRVSTDQGASWIGEEFVGACDPSAHRTPRVSWRTTDATSLRLVAEPGVAAGSRIRLTVLAGQSLDFTLTLGDPEPSADITDSRDTVPFVLTPLGGGAALSRLAIARAESRGVTDRVFILTFDVPPGHYLVRSAEAPPATAALVSVY